MNARQKMAKSQERAAMKLYQAGFCAATFTAATKGKSSRYANALTDECMALCGNPYHKLSNRIWSKAALAHLEKFATPVRAEGELHAELARRDDAAQDARWDRDR